MGEHRMEILRNILDILDINLQKWPEDRVKRIWISSYKLFVIWKAFPPRQVMWEEKMHNNIGIYNIITVKCPTTSRDFVIIDLKLIFPTFLAICDSNIWLGFLLQGHSFVRLPCIHWGYEIVFSITSNIILGI